MLQTWLSVSLLICIGTSQNAGSGVYGIAGPNFKDGGASLVKYDTSTGAVTTVVAQRNSLDPKVSGQNLGCLDAVNNIYYFVSTVVNASSPTGFTTVLYGYNLTAPSFASTIEIKLYDISAGGITGSGDACIGDPSTGNLYLFGHDANNRTNQLLLKISRASASADVDIAVLGEYNKVDDQPLLAGDPTILDTKRQRLWVAGTAGGQELYFYINLENGDVVNTVNFHQFPLIDGSTYDAGLDRIIGLTLDTTHSNSSCYLFELNEADPETLALTKQFTAGMVGYCGQMKAVTQDASNGVLYSLLLNNNDCGGNYTDDVYLVGTNVADGTQKSSVRVAQIDGAYNDAPYDIQFWNAPQ